MAKKQAKKTKEITSQDLLNDSILPPNEITEYLVKEIKDINAEYIAVTANIDSFERRKIFLKEQFSKLRKSLDDKLLEYNALSNSNHKKQNTIKGKSKWRKNSPKKQLTRQSKILST